MSEPTTIIRVYNQDGDWKTAVLRGAMPALTPADALTAWLDHHEAAGWQRGILYDLRDFLRGATRVEIETTDELGAVHIDGTLPPDLRDQAIGMVSSMASMVDTNDPDPAPLDDDELLEQVDTDLF